MSIVDEMQAGVMSADSAASREQIIKLNANETITFRPLHEILGCLKLLVHNANDDSPMGPDGRAVYQKPCHEDYGKETCPWCELGIPRVVMYAMSIWVRNTRRKAGEPAGWRRIIFSKSSSNSPYKGLLKRNKTATTILNIDFTFSRVGEKLATKYDVDVVPESLNEPLGVRVVAHTKEEMKKIIAQAKDTSILGDEEEDDYEQQQRDRQRAAKATRTAQFSAEDLAEEETLAPLQPATTIRRPVSKARNVPSDVEAVGNYDELDEEDMAEVETYAASTRRRSA